MADEESKELKHKSIRRIICMCTKITKNHDSNIVEWLWTKAKIFKKFKAVIQGLADNSKKYK